MKDMISQRTKRILDQECIELEINWLENDTIEGIDSELAQKLLTDRKTKLSYPEPPSNKTDWNTNVEIEARCWDSSEIRRFYDLLQKVGTVSSFEVKTPTNDLASFRVVMSPFTNTADLGS